MTKLSDQQQKKKEVDRLMRTMDLQSKIGQLSQVEINLMVNNNRTALRQDMVDHYIGELGVGSVLNVVSGDVPWTARDFRRAAVLIQATAKKYGRPPVIWGLDSVHGANYVHGRLVTPQPINLAATFDRDHSRRAGILASRDTRKAGINWLFSPLLGIAWEPRWSRVYETFGEDPFVVGELAQQMIQGIQQLDDDQDGNTTLTPSKAAACAKHFLGYSLPHNGHDRSPSWIPTRHLFQYFLPPWQKVVGEVETVMESYTETDGVPNVANRAALDKILRHRLGFDKLLVTDYNEIYNLNDWHRTTGNLTQAVLKSMQEGAVDMSMIPWDADTYLGALSAYHDDHEISMARIDDSVRRVLELKQRLNMFDEEIKEDDLDFSPPTDEETQQVMDMTRDSIILAKNEGNALPLASDEELKVLITGPTGKSLSYQSGGWTWTWQGIEPADESSWYTYGSTVLGAIQNSDEEVKWDVTYTCGVDILGGECEDSESDISKQKADSGKKDDVLSKVKGWIGWGDDDPTSYVAIERAVADAKDKDVVIICVGEESYAEKPGDIRSLRLPQGQYALVEAIRANTDAKIVLVYFGGRPRLLADMVEHSDAVILGFLPGPMAGQAILDIMTGSHNPSAKLPITYPLHEDAAGSPYMHAVSDQCTEDTGGPLPHYNYIQCGVQWPFGHGLSYTEFKYHDLQVTPDQIHHEWQKDDGKIDVSVTVTNTGSIAGHETVMAFSFDDHRSTTPEYKRLRGFEKVFLEPAESKDVVISIPVSDLRFVGPHDDSHYIYESLTFKIGIGAGTDCRVAPIDGSVQPCSGPISLTVDNDYVGACESACSIWNESGCMKMMGLDSKSCRKQCTSIHDDESLQMNNDGWGYNYVQCLENVVWSNNFRADTSQCWKMTTFCRNIMITPGMDELGHGNTPGAFADFGGGGGVAAIVVLVMALIAGALSTFAIITALRGGFSKKLTRFQTAEFTRVATEAYEDQVVL